MPATRTPTHRSRPPPTTGSRPGPGLDPVVGGGRLRCVGVRVAGIGATGEHVHQANLSRWRRFVIEIGIDPIPGVLVPTHGIWTRCFWVVRHASETISPFAQRSHCALVDG